MSYIFLDTAADWTAIGTMALAALTFITLVISVIYNQITLGRAKQSSLEQIELLRSQLAAQNENAFRYNSVKLVLVFDEQFMDMTETRVEAATLILSNNILERGPVQKGELRDLMDDIYDLFDTIGYFVRKGYIKADVAHAYFYHWFSRYYAFYKQYKVKESTDHEEAVWNNLHFLSRELSGIEDHQSGDYPHDPGKHDLIKFFNQEKDLSGE